MTKIEQIMLACEKVFHVTRKELTGKRQHQNIAAARMAAAYLLQTEGNVGRIETAQIFRRSRPWASMAYYAASDRGEADKGFSGRLSAAYGMVKGVAA